MGGHFLPVQSKEDHFWIEAFCHQPSCYLPFLIFILVFIVWSMSKMFCLVTWWIFPVNSMVVMLILLYNCFFFFFQEKDFCYICVYNLLFCFVFDSSGNEFHSCTNICIPRVIDPCNIPLYQVVLSFCCLIVFCFILSPRMSLF